MKPVERQQRILQDVETIDDDLIPKLSQKYQVSEMTIRRDLKVLEEEGLIVRTFGGAMRLPKRPQTTADLPPVWSKRASVAAAAKASIGRYAAQHLVCDGDIIILEGGTTAAAMIEHLADKPNLTVVTHGLITLAALLRHLPPTATIICPGGILQTDTGTFVGPVATRFFREFHAHRTFLSATGLTLEVGATEPKMLETDVKQAMAQASTQVILLLDSSKFGVQSLMKVVALQQIDTLVTDAGAPEDVVAELRAAGIEVIIAPE